MYPVAWFHMIRVASEWLHASVAHRLPARQCRPVEQCELLGRISKGQQERKATTAVLGAGAKVFYM